MTALSVSDLDLTDPRLHDAVDRLIAHQHAVSAGDEDRADALLADLERPLRRLSWAQNEWLRGLSGDLQMLSGEEVHEPNRQPADDYRRAVLSAWANVEDDPEALLALLRKEQAFLSEDKVAYGRARAYAALGLQEAAAQFVQHAIILDPDATAYKAFVLTHLTAEQRQAEFPGLVDDLLTSPDIPLAFAVGAARALYEDVSLLPESQARPLLGGARRRVETAIKQHLAEGLEAEDAMLGMLLLADVCARLRRASDARRWYQKAIALTPDDDAPYVGMGIFLCREGRPEAAGYFAEAIRRGTRFSFPYLCLAQSALTDGRYEECRQLAGQGLAFADGPHLKAVAVELIGFSRLRQDGPTDEVLRILRDAVDHDPQNNLLRDNLDAVREARRLQETSVTGQEKRPSYATLGNALVIQGDLLRSRLADVSSQASRHLNRQLAVAA